MSMNIQLSARKRIVNIFGRASLDRLSGLSRPWLADTSTLKQSIVVAWPEQEIKEELYKIMRDAK